MEYNYSFAVDPRDGGFKQHINLSEEAWMVINEDIQNFYETEKERSLSGFLNTIFQNFYQSANASISIRLAQKEEELKNIYSSKEVMSLGNDVLIKIIRAHMRAYREELLNKANGYMQGHGEKFRINNDNIEILSNSSEGPYYSGSIGKYFKAIIEEYSEKPSYLREQIFFADNIKFINQAIDTRKKIKIALQEKVSAKNNAKYTKKFLLSPYFITQDETRSFNYVIGYSEEIIDVVEEDESGNKHKSSFYKEKVAAPFRISRIKTIKKSDIQSSMGLCYSKEKEDYLRKSISEKTAMFLSGEIKEIKVKFTDKGLESFKRQLYMRPKKYKVDSKDHHIYIFSCTELQAISYFYKFGWDCLIIDPEELALKFKKRYKSALLIYEGKTKEEVIKELQ